MIGSGEVTARFGGRRKGALRLGHGSFEAHATGYRSHSPPLGLLLAAVPLLSDRSWAAV